MFTGIIQGNHPITRIQDAPGLRMFAVALPPELRVGLVQGASVSVAGVCLTAVRIEDDAVVFEAMEETLAKTTLGALNIGDAVNIERAAKIGDELGGHVVSGHVDATAEIIAIDARPDSSGITFRVDAALMPYILSKGFVALDGCSLTIVDVGADTFSVWLIPETLRTTTFGARTVGERVNLEIDRQTQAIVETVKRFMT